MATTGVTVTRKPLAVRLQCVRFSRNGPHDLNELRRVLQAQDAARPMPIRELSDSLLNGDGLIQNRYRFTTGGLASLCSLLSPGLGSLVANLSGLRSREAMEGRAEPRDVSLAIHTLNAVIRLRHYSHLLGHSWIVDPRSRTVEGIVGPRYAFLSNWELFAMCEDFVGKDLPGGPVQLTEATLWGRRLYLRYGAASEVCRLSGYVDASHTFRRGWSFSNSETGDASVKMAWLLVDGAGNGARKTIGKLKHVGELGPAKIKRLFKLLASTTAANPWRDCCGQLATLQTTGLALPIDSSASLKQRMRAISNRLSRRIPQQLAKSVVSDAVSNGSFPGEGIARGCEMSREALAPLLRRRSCYDVYTSLLRQARKLDFDARERLEKLAYELLIGTVRF